MNLNLSASLNVFKLLASPSLCLPHATVATFNDLPVPLEKAFEKEGRKVDIKAVILDKDDCFAYPDSIVVHGPYKVELDSLNIIPFSLSLLSHCHPCSCVSECP